MTEPGSKILQRMLERLYASLASGPLMACRPHASRQRVDLSQLARLEGPTGSALISALLSGERSVKLTLPKLDPNEVEPDPSATDAAAAPVKKKDALQALWSKLRTISEDARTYVQGSGSRTRRERRCRMLHGRWRSCAIRSITSASPRSQASTRT